jgi:hypothetical protein
MGTAQGQCSLSFGCLTDDLGFKDSRSTRIFLILKVFAAEVEPFLFCGVYPFKSGDFRLEDKLAGA